MAASTFGAIKAFLEAQGLGIAVFKDLPPSSVKNAKTGVLNAPYCIVIPNIAPLRPDKLEDGIATTGTETVQLDLYQNWRNASDQNVESATLPDAIFVALQGSRLMQTGTGVPPKTVYAVLVSGPLRIVERDSRLVRHTYTLSIKRSLV